nr:hypothetical protein [Actinomycetota bacterium]
MSNGKKKRLIRFRHVLTRNRVLCGQWAAGSAQARRALAVLAVVLITPAAVAQPAFAQSQETRLRVAVPELTDEQLADAGEVALDREALAGGAETMVSRDPASEEATRERNRELFGRLLDDDAGLPVVNEEEIAKAGTEGQELALAYGQKASGEKFPTQGAQEASKPAPKDRPSEGQEVPPGPAAPGGEIAQADPQPPSASPSAAPTPPTSPAQEPQTGVSQEPSSPQSGQPQPADGSPDEPTALGNLGLPGAEPAAEPEPAAPPAETEAPEQQPASPPAEQPSAAPDPDSGDGGLYAAVPPAEAPAAPETETGQPQPQETAPGGGTESAPDD